MLLRLMVNLFTFAKQIFYFLVQVIFAVTNEQQLQCFFFGYSAFEVFVVHQELHQIV